MPQDTAPIDVAGLVDLWAWVTDLYKTIEADIQHWEAHQTSPPPGSPPKFVNTVTRRLDEAREDLAWLQHKLKSHLKRKDPPHALREDWRKRKEGHLVRAMSDAINAVSVLIKRVVDERVEPTHDELVNAVRFVLGAIQFTSPHDAGPARIQGASDPFVALAEIAKHKTVVAARRGTLDRLDEGEEGEEGDWSHHGTVGAAAAVFLWRAGVPLTARQILDRFVFPPRRT